MGTNLNFKNFTNDPSSIIAGGGGGGTGSRPNFPITRQPSIYSLTFEEFQNTLGGLGKDYGSMNMDELLKNIWSAEETQQQTMAAAAVSNTGGGAQEGGGLQRQGSLTLPRTLSQKTVDEVWRDILKEYGGGGGGGGGGGSGGGGGGANGNLPQRQQTLGEMTLEEFLARAGVVREDVPLAGKVNVDGGYFSTNPVLGIGFQQNRGLGVGLSNITSNGNTNQVSMQSSNLPLNVNGFRSNQVHAEHQQQQQQQQHQQIFPKQVANVGYVTQMPLQSSPGIRGGIVGIGDQGISGGLMQGGGMGIAGLGGVAMGSPVSQMSSDGIGKSNGDTSSVSPVPYAFNGGLRGRRVSGAVEKVAERRQRRMIKNRESAARSRARKQAYTMELEAEVAKLKEENQELRRKQAEIMEMQKDQVMEMMNQQQGVKKQCLRRTQTGPW